MKWLLTKDAYDKKPQTKLLIDRQYQRNIYL